MKILDIFNEEFKDGFKVKDNYYQVFKNPSLKEMKEIKSNSEFGTIRFVLSYNEKLIYMWSGDVLHETALRKANINIPYNLYSKEYYYGISVMKTNKLALPKDLEKIFKKLLSDELVDFYSKFIYIDK